MTYVSQLQRGQLHGPELGRRAKNVEYVEEGEMGRVVGLLGRQKGGRVHWEVA